WATLVANVSGCLLIGVLMVVVTELVTPHRLLRPFLGVGVLGSYTTFSTATVETLTLLHASGPLAALGYAVVTPVLAVLACGGGVVGTRLVAGRPRWRAGGGACPSRPCCGWRSAPRWGRRCATWSTRPARPGTGAGARGGRSPSTWPARPCSAR